MNQAKERKTIRQKRFEEWAFKYSELEEGSDFDHGHVCYIDDQMELAWNAWQAAEDAGWNAALEAAEKHFRQLKPPSGECMEPLWPEEIVLEIESLRK
jgi:hypothetical protein